MCDSGLVIVVLLTSFFVLVALQSIFYSFDYNCNNFYYDDVVGGGIHSWSYSYQPFVSTVRWTLSAESIERRRSMGKKYQKA